MRRWSDARWHEAASHARSAAGWPGAAPPRNRSARSRGPGRDACSTSTPDAVGEFQVAGEPILIVDDNPVNLKLIRVLLTSEGYEVRTATSSEDALTVLSRFSPRLILMDIQLPGMDGLALTRQLKAETATRNTVILALTAYAMKGDEERMLAAGCDGYVSKPIDTRTLPGIVARHLAATPA
jgi:two-component system, cell cycle response regulator DivK